MKQNKRYKNTNSPRQFSRSGFYEGTMEAGESKEWMPGRKNSVDSRVWECLREEMEVNKWIAWEK